jgi:protein-tyrosine phosphatase/predicted heme/steroid binding protein
MEEVATHNREGDVWVVVHNYVYDLSSFTEIHPGGRQILIQAAGQDATSSFIQYRHPASALARYHAKLCVGRVKGDHPNLAPGSFEVNPVSGKKTIHGFLVRPPEESPWYSADKMPQFTRVRAITSYTRPQGNHGCKLTEIVPGLWTAHFQDINQPDCFTKLPILPPMGLVVNSAVAYGQCPTYSGFYIPKGEIRVLPIDLFDDPKEADPHSHAGNAKQYFPLVNQQIRETIAGGKSVLVHCMASLSRSICFLIAYLMDEHKMPLESATAFIKAKWDATYPNDSYVFQLIEYQAELESARNQ